MTIVHPLPTGFNIPNVAGTSPQSSNDLCESSDLTMETVVGGGGEGAGGGE